MEIKEYTQMSNFIHVSLERVLLTVSKTWGFKWKTPPHDIARRLMNHIKEFLPFNEGGE